MMVVQKITLAQFQSLTQPLPPFFLAPQNSIMALLALIAVVLYNYSIHLHIQSGNFKVNLK